MKTTDKLKSIKETLSLCFINATEKSLAHGQQYKYKSYFSEDITFGVHPNPVKGWVVDIFVAEAGYAERNVQQFRYPKPEGVDNKNMEYSVLMDVLFSFTQTALLSYNEVSKLLATDKELQKSIKDESSKNNFSTN